LVMRQFDVCRLRPARTTTGAQTEYVVILQSDLSSDLATRVLAPLLPAEQLPALGRLRPEINVNGRLFRMLVDRMAAASTKEIGPVVGSCADREYEIRRALDIVFLGV
jgi:hypothetical protein